MDRVIKKDKNNDAYLLSYVDKDEELEELYVYKKTDPFFRGLLFYSKQYRSCQRRHSVTLRWTDLKISRVVIKRHIFVFLSLKM